MYCLTEILSLSETFHKKKREAIQLSSSINDIKKRIDEVHDKVDV